MARSSAFSTGGAGGVAGTGGTSGRAGASLAARVGPAAACGAAFALPLCYVPSLSSVFAEPKQALLWVAGALGIAGQLLVWAHGAPRARWSRALPAAIAALVITTAISAAVVWAGGILKAPYAVLELGRLLAVVGVALAAAQATLDETWRRRLLTSIHVSAGLVSILGLLQHLQILPLAIPTISIPGSTFGNRNIAAEAVAMSLPFGVALLVLGRRPGRPGQPPIDSPVPTLALLALQIVYLGATRTRGAWLGVGAGIAVLLVLRRRALPRAAWRVAVVLGLAALAAAVIPGRMTKRDVRDAKRFASGENVVREAVDPASPVVRTRLGLWRRTLAMYRDHPLLGVGPGNFVVFFPLYAEPGATADGVLSPETVPRRAHQDLLERLAETGPLGLAALLAVYLAGGMIAVRRARRADGEFARSQVGLGAGLGASAGAVVAAPAASRSAADEAVVAAAAAGALAALFACGLTGFPLAMPATALLFGVALGFLGGEGGVVTSGAPPSGRAGRALPWWLRLAAGLVAVALVGGVAVAAGRMVARSYWLARAQAALRAGNRPGLGAPAALVALRHANRADPGRFQVALETAFVLVRLDRYVDAMNAVDWALRIEPHSANAWSLRAEAALGAGDARRAAEDAKHAIAILADNPDALATLTRAYARLANPVAAAEARARLAALAGSGSGRARRLLEALGAEGEAQ